ncbi:venom protein 302 isoform X2 [Hydra vulgaris]|uniref:Venom protein 302 isoform X2 n=1 Tax=Hydra vulgaris TaxID=6087 RepID=A0ABM4B7X0_HYDVU
MGRFILTLCFFYSIFEFSTALTCVGCDKRVCLAPVCKGGIVKDPCNCCDVCAKTLDEECGGPFGIFGKCDSHLECVKQPIEIDIRNARGKCRPICTQVCLSYCENGNIVDRNGCPTCQCKTK